MRKPVFWFLTRSDTKRTVKPQKMVRVALLIGAFVFAFPKTGFLMTWLILKRKPSQQKHMIIVDSMLIFCMLIFILIQNAIVKFGVILVCKSVDSKLMFQLITANL